jgi:hypothetical protein
LIDGGVVEEDIDAPKLPKDFLYDTVYGIEFADIDREVRKLRAIDRLRRGCQLVGTATQADHSHAWLTREGCGKFTAKATTCTRYYDYFFV